MEPSRRLQGKVALVTGATGGIGSAIAKRLGSEGASLILGFQHREAEAQMLHRALREAGVPSSVARMDVGSRDSVHAAIDSSIAHHGRLDILVNNAGILKSASIDQFTDEDWDLTFTVNVKGAVHCTREAAIAMKVSGGGVVVNIASRFALLGAPNSLAYGASKAALVNVTKALANYYAPAIRVNAVAPAYTLTPLTSSEPPAFLESFVNAVPLHRAASPEDTAAAVAYLASDDAAFVTGQTLYVDGGFSIRS